MNTKNTPLGVVGQYLASPGRSWFDRSFPHLASYPIGKVVPDACIPLTGNTTVKLDIMSMLQTNPTPTPVFDSAKCNVYVFFCPQRNYVRGLQNDNYMELDEIEQKALPTLGTMSGGRGDFNIIGYGSLLNRLGHPAGYIAGSLFYPADYDLYFADELQLPLGINSSLSSGATSLVGMNMSAVCAYYDACTYFLANPYDPEIPFDDEKYGLASFGDGTYQNFKLFSSIYDDNDAISVVTYHNLKSIQDTLQRIRGIADTTDFSTIANQQSYFGNMAMSAIGFGTLPLTIPLYYSEGGSEITLPEDYVWASANAVLATRERVLPLFQRSVTTGLFPATYMEDFQNTWFDVDSINSLNAVPLALDESTTVQSARIQHSIWNRMLRSILRGRRLSDWMDIQFGRKLNLSNHPILVGSDHFDITWDDVLSHNANNGPDGDGVPLGGAASRGRGGSSTNGRGNRDRTITFTTQEPGYLLIVRSIVPYVSYPNARARHWDYEVMADFPLPMYSGKQFQDLVVSDVAMTSDKTLNDTVIGKQPLYYDHMTGTYTLGGLMQTKLYDSYTFKRTPNLNFNSPNDLLASVDAISSTYVIRQMYDFQFTDWSQNNGENIFIKSFYNLRCFQPLDKQVIKTRL